MSPPHRSIGVFRSRLVAFGCSLASLLIVADTGRTEERKLAIVSDEGTAAFEALLANELSDRPSISLLERSALGAIVSEKSLGSLGKQVELAGGDYLIVLESHEDTDPPLIGLRVVDADGGNIEIFRLFPGGDAGKETIRHLADEIARVTERTSEGDGKPVALLGLRFELPQKEHPAREYALNQVVASALHSAPGLRVLERWQSEAILFERIARQGSDQPVEAGAVLVDGTLSESQGKIRVSLRMRSGGEGEAEVAQLERERDDLTGLAEEVVTKILKWTDSAALGERNPKAEADMQARLAGWAMVNGFGDEAVASAETAMALMPTDPGILLASVKAYAFRAWPNSVDLESFSYTNHFPQDFHPAPHLRDALQALLRLDDFERGFTKTNLPEGFPDLEKTSLRVTFDLACLSRRIQESGRRDKVEADHRALQDALRARVDALSRSPSLEIRTDLGFALVAWTSAWSADAASAFEALDALLKMDLGPNDYRRDPVRMVFSDALFIEFGGHGNRNYTPNSGRLLPDPNTRDQDKAVWLEKASELTGRESIRDRITGYSLLLALSRTDETVRKEVLEEFSKLAWENRKLLTSENMQFILKSMKMLFLELSDGVAPETLADFNRRFLGYIVEEVDAPAWNGLDPFSDRLLTWSEEDAAALIELIEAKKAKLAATGGESGERNARSLQSLALRLGSRNRSDAPPAMVRRDQFTPKPAPPSPAGSLRVTEWLSPAASAYGTWVSFHNYEGFARDESGEFWAMNRYGLFRFSSDASEAAKLIFLPKVSLVGFVSLAVLPRHVAITGGGEVWIVDKDKGNWWERIPLPVTEYHLMSSGRRLFMLYRPAYQSGDRESGVIAYDPETRELEVITSSRKENQGDGPDGRGDWVPLHAFAQGPSIAVAGELVDLSENGHVMYLRGADKRWSRPFVTNPLIGSSFVTDEGGILLTLGGGNFNGVSDAEQVIHFPPGGTGPELLARLANPQEKPHYDRKPALPGDPRWIMPDRLCEIDPNLARKSSVLYHEGRLYIATSDFDRRNNLHPANRMLHVFDRDGSVRSLPLDFAPSPALEERPGLTELVLQRLRDSGPIPKGMFATEDGLLLGTGLNDFGAIEAFWTIPFSEIDALLKSDAFPNPLAGAEK